MLERLQKILSARGIASRRDAEALILAGRVTVDGAPAELGQRADPVVQVICVDGQPVTASLSERVYIMLNKPRGYVSTVRDDRGRRTVLDLIGDGGKGLWPVGRLDRDSQGLLLMTDDGDVTRRLTHPSFEVEKVYRVYVRNNAELKGGGDLAEKAVRMEEPLTIDGELLRPAKVRLVREMAEGGVLEVRIREGKNRQVRKMCALFDLHVTRLVRVGEGELQLGDLKTGTWRHLTAAEVAYLQGV
ncbi:MAG: rRNA pseudouridine synthase [Oscillospiraceae bacterium]|nr:rRNA pseudouridine synthase [Oscillospiraceae bacterium]